MSAYCKCYHCGAEDGIDIDDGVCSECGYPDKVIEELRAEVARLRGAADDPDAVERAAKALCDATWEANLSNMRFNITMRDALILVPSILRAAIAGKKE